MTKGQHPAGSCCLGRECVRKRAVWQPRPDLRWLARKVQGAHCGEAGIFSRTRAMHFQANPQHTGHLHTPNPLNRMSTVGIG
jgi:hypothetical protein